MIILFAYLKYEKIKVIIQIWFCNIVARKIDSCCYSTYNKEQNKLDTSLFPPLKWPFQKGVAEGKSTATALSFKIQRNHD